jgi:hypothetical protein
MSFPFQEAGSFTLAVRYPRLRHFFGSQHTAEKALCQKKVAGKGCRKFRLTKDFFRRMSQPSFYESQPWIVKIKSAAASGSYRA